MTILLLEYETVSAKISTIKQTMNSFDIHVHSLIDIYILGYHILYDQKHYQFSKAIRYTKEYDFKRSYHETVYLVIHTITAVTTIDQQYE